MRLYDLRPDLFVSVVGRASGALRAGAALVNRGAMFGPLGLPQPRATADALPDRISCPSLVSQMALKLIQATKHGKTHFAGTVTGFRPAAAMLPTPSDRESWHNSARQLSNTLVAFILYRTGYGDSLIRLALCLSSLRYRSGNSPVPFASSRHSSVCTENCVSELYGKAGSPA